MIRLLVVAAIVWLVISFIRRSLAGPSSPAAPPAATTGHTPEPGEAEQFAADVLALRGLLRRSDMLALEHFAQLRLTHGGPLSPALAQMEAALANLNFEAAAALCDTLLPPTP